MEEAQVFQQLAQHSPLWDAGLPIPEPRGADIRLLCSPVEPSCNKGHPFFGGWLLYMGNLDLEPKKKGKRGTTGLPRLSWAPAHVFPVDDACELPRLWVAHHIPRVQIPMANSEVSTGVQDGFWCCFILGSVVEDETSHLGKGREHVLSVDFPASGSIFLDPSYLGCSFGILRKKIS